YNFRVSTCKSLPRAFTSTCFVSGISNVASIQPWLLKILLVGNLLILIYNVSACLSITAYSEIYLTDVCFKPLAVYVPNRTALFAGVASIFNSYGPVSTTTLLISSDKVSSYFGKFFVSSSALTTS